MSTKTRWSWALFFLKSGSGDEVTEELRAQESFELSLLKTVASITPLGLLGIGSYFRL